MNQNERKGDLGLALILKGARPYLLIGTIIFLVYFQVLFFDFSYLDDNALILDRAAFIQNLGNFFQAFREDVFISLADAYYRPLMTVSLMFDAQLAGVQPFFFHLTNVALHIFASCLIFSLLIQLKYQKDLALFFALIFAVHPVLTQAVAWIPGRNDSLLAIFVLTSFFCFLKFLERRENKYLAGNLIFFLLGAFTKETALMLPLVEGVYLFFVGRDRKFIFSQKWLWLGSGGVISFWFFFRSLAFQNPIEIPWQALVFSTIKNSPAVIQFFGKIFFPFNLSVLPILQDTTFWTGILALVSIVTLLFWTREKKFNLWFFGIFWFLVFLLPSFIRPNFKIVADFIEHRVYLSLLGLFILVAETDFLRSFSLEKKIWRYGSLLFLLFFAGLTIFHSQNFRDRNTFWENASLNSPHSPLAHRNWGAMLFLDKKLEEAEKEYLEALKLNPEEPMAHNNLGLIYLNRGELEKAKQELEKERESNPYYDAVYFNLGLLSYRMGKITEAEEFWKKALELNPGYADAWHSLAVAYYEEKNFAEASKFAREALRRGAPLPEELLKLIQSPLEINP